MRLGVAVNVFDGVDLLERSISSYRSVVDYVCVIVQSVSNYGDHDGSAAAEALRLKASGLVDDVFLYQPVRALLGHKNEVNKRNLGLEKCREAGCSHHMSVDVDEFYVLEELARAKEMMDGYDASACQMQTYYKSGEWVIDPPEEYFVSLIYRIDSRKFEISAKWPVPVDPTRRMKSDRILLFPRDVVQMHHFSYVRKDLRKKLVNSSANKNFKNVDEVVDYFERWVPGTPGMVARLGEQMVDLRKVKNRFDI